MGNLNSGRCYLITTVNTQVIIKVETDHYLRQVGWTFYVIDFFFILELNTGVKSGVKMLVH